MSISEKLTTIASNQTKVYDAGKKAEYDAFWDAYQTNGTRKNYEYAFYGIGWKDEIFNPKYPITLEDTNARYMFFNSRLIKPDLSKVDFSKCTSTINLFYGCNALEELGILNFSSVVVGHNGLKQTFDYCSKLRKIEKIIMPQTPIQNHTFVSCVALTEIRFEGVLGGNQNFQWCPLSVESMKSIISCLKNYSGTSEELTYKLTFKPECWDALEADSPAPDGGTWLNYVTSLGWNT